MPSSNKYLSQQISKKFKNKHRKNTYSTKSIFPRKCVANDKHCCKLCKILQKKNCKFGSKKELRRLRKLHLRKCNWCHHQIKLQNETKKTNLNDLIENPFDYLIGYGYISDEPWSYYELTPTYVYDHNMQIGYVDDSQTGMIFDELYDFEETHHWISLKYEKKNKYLSQKIHKKFKNKRKLFKQKSGMKKRLKQKSKKQSRKYNKVSNIKYEINCNGYNYQELYNELFKIDEFYDTESISENENIQNYNHEITDEIQMSPMIVVKTNKKQTTSTVTNTCFISKNHWLYSDLLQCNVHLSKGITYARMLGILLYKKHKIRDKWTIGSRCKIYSSELNKWCRGIIIEIVGNHIEEQLKVGYHNQNGWLFAVFNRIEMVHRYDANQIQPWNAQYSDMVQDITETCHVTGYITDKINDCASIIIEDMDENIRPLWNKTINFTKQDFDGCFEMLCVGQRVLFNIWCYPSYKGVVNYNINGLKFVKCEAYNVRLPEHQSFGYLDEEYTWIMCNYKVPKNYLLVCGYLKIYLNRFDMYVPHEIENLIFWYYKQYISNQMKFSGTSRFNCSEYFINRYIMRHRNVPNFQQRYNVIVNKYGLNKNAFVTYCFKMKIWQMPSGYIDMGIVSYPHNIHKYLKTYGHAKEWFHEINGSSCCLCQLNYHDYQNGDIFELSISFKSSTECSLILYKNSILVDSTPERIFDDDLYYPYIAFSHIDSDNEQNAQFEIWNIDNIHS
eukprot:178067_1